MGYITQGPFANWIVVGSGIPNDKLQRQNGQLNTTLPTPEKIASVMIQPHYDCFPWNENATCFRNLLEGNIPLPRDMHNLVHVWIGGTMRNISISANDPIFYLHHSNVDRLFELWLKRFGYGSINHPAQGAAYSTNRYDCIVPLFPLMSHNDFLVFSEEIGYQYILPAAVSPIQQGDNQRDTYLRVILYGLTNINTNARIGIVGAGISGLVEGYILKKAGFSVFIFEGSTSVGGRMATDLCDFSLPPRKPGNVTFLEKGSMRFPCSHWAIFGFVKLFNISMRTFKNNNPNGLILLECLDNIPVPRHVIDPSDPQFNPALLCKIFDCFGVQDPYERRPTGDLLSEVFQLYIRRITSNTSTFEEIIAELNPYSLKSLLQYHGYSENAILMIGVLENLDSLMLVNAGEIFRDFAGQWWSDELVCSWPNDPIYSNFPTRGLLEFSEGASTLPNSFYEYLSDNVYFDHKVIGVEYGETFVTLTMTTNGETRVIKQTFDFTVFAIPYSIMRTFSFIPPFQKQASLRHTNYIESTKVLVQLKNRTMITRPSPNVPLQYTHPGIADGTGGSSLTDSVLGPLYYPTNPTGNRGLCVFYTWGRNARIVSTMTTSELRTKVYEIIRQLHGDEAANDLEIVTVKGWAVEPNAQGAFLLHLPEQMDLDPEITQNVGRMVFIGDDKSFQHGWAQGAIYSAVRGAISIYNAAKKLFFPPPDFFSQFDGTISMPNNETTIFCGHNSELVTRTFSNENDYWYVTASQVETLGFVNEGNVTVTIGGQSATITEGSSYIIPAFTDASFQPNTVPSQLVHSRASEDDFVCHHGEYRLYVTWKSTQATTLPVVGDLPNVLAGNPDPNKFAEIANANSYRAAFGIGSVHFDKTLAGLFVISSDLVFNLQTGDPTSNDYLKLITGRTVYPLFCVAFPTDPFSVFMNIEFVSPPNNFFRAVTITDIFKSALDIVQKSFCFVGGGQFSTLYGSMLLEAPLNSTANFSSVAFSGVTAYLVGCYPSRIPSYGQNYVFPYFNLPVVYAIVMDKTTTSFNDFDQIPVQHVLTVVQLLQESQPYSVSLDVYSVAKFNVSGMPPISTTGHPSRSSRVILSNFVFLLLFACM